jgi:4-amino-4-deoxychorismate lyase
MTKSSNTILINGVAADYLHISNRAIHYGDGLFETILCDNNQLLYWQRHYQRLQCSSAKLNVNCPDEHLLLADIKTLLDDTEQPLNSQYVIKIIISRGAGKRGYLFDNDSKETRIVMLSALDPDYSTFATGRLLTGELYLCEQQVSINKNLAGIKHLNRLENVLARNEWEDSATNTIIDGLMLDANAHVIEGTMSNLFTVKDQRLITPNLEYSGVKGIMRDVIIDIAKQDDIDVSISDITLEELLSMDECFITNSLIGIKAVDRIADTTYQSDKLTKLIFEQLLKTKNNNAQII